MVYTGVEPTTSICGGILTETSGTIVSPNYNDPYPNDINCSWTIRLPQGWRVQFSLNDISIENQTTCRYKH